jgi:hypothetical protein
MIDHKQQGGEDGWMLLMRNGEFAKAWHISDAALAARAGKPCWHLPRHLQHIWDGTPLSGKRVLVRCYHGLGDTIQFIRYAPLVKATASRLIVWAQPALLPLLETVTAIDTLLPLHDGTPELAYDVDVEIMELAHVFRTTGDTIPSHIPYLPIEPDVTLRRENVVNVGLVWKAGSWDDRRSIPFTLLAPLFGVAGVNIIILQGDAQAAGWVKGFGIHPGELGLYQYARVLRGMDLLISVDSMPAHLAGALGVPVWNLLRYSADWRWMENRSDSPWYPTMRLFRQEHAGEWDPVINQVVRELQHAVITRGAPSLLSTNATKPGG